MEAREKMPKVSNTVNNHGGRVHSLYTAPVFQRSPYASSEVTHPQGSEYSAARNLREQGQTTDLPRDRAKEGPGRRLLNMLRKTLIGPESKELEITPGGPTLVPFGDVVGCLAIHVKNCRHFTPKINLQHYNNFFIRISINNVVKCTKTCSLLHQNNDNSTMIKFNDVKYFSVQVPRHQDDKRNNIFLELMQNDTTGKYPLLLGRAQVHLYKIIKKGCFTEEFHILNKNTFICRVEAEFIFSYGNFGYGYSHQLKSLEKIIKPSMFMNIAPPPERTDPVTNVIIPQPIEYPAFLSPDLNVSVGMPATMSQSKQPFAVRLEKLHQQPRERLEKMKKEYRNLNTWMEKSNYLKGVLNSQLEHKEPKGSNTSKVPENQFEERPEDTVTSVVPLIKEEAEMIPSELLDSDDEKGLTLRDKDTSSTIAPKIDESTKQADTPLSILPSLTITEENKISPLEDYQSEAMPYGKMKNIFFPPQVKLKNRYSSILKTDSCPSEVKLKSIYINPGRIKRRNLDSSLIEIRWQSNNLSLARRKRTSRVFPDSKSKGSFQSQAPKEDPELKVVFSQKEYISPSFRPEYIEFKPKYQFQKFSMKDGFDPFLRNINNRKSVRKMKDQNMSRCRNILSAEVIELEDQDPPYPTHSKTGRPTNKICPRDPDSITVMTSDRMDKLASDPGITTITGLDTKNKLKERLPNISSSNFERASSMPGNANVNAYHLSKSLNLTFHIENLKQSMVLKSILTKNLQDFSDKLFSKAEVTIDTEARKKSHCSPLLSVHDEPPNSLEDKVFENIQDLNSCLSTKSHFKFKVSFISDN